MLNNNVVWFQNSKLSMDETLFMFVGMQKEYITDGRAYHIPENQHCTDNVKAILGYARNRGLPIAHFKNLRSQMFFNKNSAHSDWIEGFEPRANEMVYEHSSLSCFANEEFCRFLQFVEKPHLVLCGFSGDGTCLASAIDGNQKKYDLIYVTDASASRPFVGFSQQQSHELVTQIISGVSKLTTTRKLIENMGHEPRQPMEKI